VRGYGKRDESELTGSELFGIEFSTQQQELEELRRLTHCDRCGRSLLAAPHPYANERIGVLHALWVHMPVQVNRELIDMTDKGKEYVAPVCGIVGKLLGWLPNTWRARWPLRVSVVCLLESARRLSPRRPWRMTWSGLQVHRYLAAPGQCT
jgi:hypothetical protein